MKETRTCKKCSQEKSISRFGKTYPKKLASGETKRYILHTCLSCINIANKRGRTSEQQKAWVENKKRERRKRKERAVVYKGGKCEMCNKEFHVAAFDFHHKNPDEKEIDPGLLMQQKDEVLFKELDKCMLLCANCHRILHYEEGTLGEIKARKRKS